MSNDQGSGSLSAERGRSVPRSPFSLRYLRWRLYLLTLGSTGSRVEVHPGTSQIQFLVRWQMLMPSGIS